MLWVYFPLLVVVAGFLILLWKSGHALIAGSPLERASWAFVLPGETPDCEATDAAAAWIEEGRIDTLVVIGSRTYKTRFTTEWARDYLETQGVPSSRLFEMRVEANSTLDIARQVLRLARLQDIDTLHLIVSSFQSRRMALLYTRLSGGMPVVQVHPVATPSMRPNAWWATAPSQTLWFFGWMGYAHTWWETWRMEPDRIEAEVRNLTPDIWSPTDLALPESEAEANEPLPSQTGPDSLQVAANDSVNVVAVADSASKVLDSLKAEAKSEAKAESKTEAKADSKSDAKTESKSEPKKEAKKTEAKKEASTKDAPKKDAKKESKKDNKKEPKK